ncbi:MAG: AraC family transcriptional regulator [Sinobacteraceae bacterium]|nr:AraC family transcriptional regulator [Nevskiaceae bacterium]
MRREETTLNTWAIALVRTLDTCGCDSRALLQRAGLEPALLQNPNGRVPVSAMVRLWRLAVEASGDPCLGLKAASFIQPATFHSLGLALLASQNLEDALQRSARFSRIVSSAVDMRIERVPQGLKQVVRWSANVPTVPEAIDLLMAATLKMGLLLLGLEPQAPRPLELRLRRGATPAMRIEFEAYFRCPIHFEADEDSLFIPHEWTRLPLPMANPSLARQNDLVVMEYLARFDAARLSDKVRAELISRLPAGEPARADVAAALHLSEKTLQRRLKEEATSYQALLDEVRRDLALQYLHEEPASVCEVTFRLGFSDQSSFTRAFRRWTGLTPGEFRNQASLKV